MWCLQMIPTAMGPIPPHMAAQGMAAYAVPAPAAMQQAAAAGKQLMSTGCERGFVVHRMVAAAAFAAAALCPR